MIQFLDFKKAPLHAWRIQTKTAFLLYMYLTNLLFSFAFLHMHNHSFFLTGYIFNIKFELFYVHIPKY